MMQVVMLKLMMEVFNLIKMVMHIFLEMVLIRYNQYLKIKE